ncbi:hypothetical protein, partial [Stappia sp. P2PMeth1]|uniref:hypothetical protein n=1 Tax=Stappia sp. P2PMeth1 TaxID=2003586 RepID=UPI001AD8D08D
MTRMHAAAIASRGRLVRLSGLPGLLSGLSLGLSRLPLLAGALAALAAVSAAHATPLPREKPAAAAPLQLAAAPSGLPASAVRPRAL